MRNRRDEVPHGELARTIDANQLQFERSPFRGGESTAPTRRTLLKTKRTRTDPHRPADTVPTTEESSWCSPRMGPWISIVRILPESLGNGDVDVGKIVCSTISGSVRSPSRSLVSSVTPSLQYMSNKVTLSNNSICKDNRA